MFPQLGYKNIPSEAKKYSQYIKDCVVNEYLFNSVSHRWLDKNITKAPPSRQGYVAMGILHSFGLTNEHKGVFHEKDVLSAIEILNTLSDERATEISRSLMRCNENISEVLINNDEEMGYPEGRIAFRLHKVRERNPRVINEAKKQFAAKNDGAVFCEVCKFNFSSVYGDRGSDFIEGHHKRPIYEMQENETTKIEDIALLCSNCHRMIHKSPIITIEELQDLLLNRH